MHELLSHDPARAMQVRLAGADGDVEHAADLPVCAAVHIVQQQYVTKSSRECAQASHQSRREVRVARRVVTLDFDGLITGNPPPLVPPFSTMSIDDSMPGDAEQPARNRCIAAKIMNTGERGDERVLRAVVRNGVAACLRPKIAAHARREPSIELSLGGRIAAPDAIDDVSVAGVRRCGKGFAGARGCELRRYRSSKHIATMRFGLSARKHGDISNRLQVH